MRYINARYLLTYPVLMYEAELALAYLHIQRLQFAHHYLQLAMLNTAGEAGDGTW